MATSRAAALQSLVLDESLRQYQSAAVSSVQNLASTFTNIAHALQKDKAQSAQHSQTVQRQLATLATTINEHAHMIEELRQEQATMYSRIADLLGRPSSGGRGRSDLVARLEKLERMLDMDPNESGDDDGGSIGEHGSLENNQDRSLVNLSSDNNDSLHPSSSSSSSVNNNTTTPFRPPTSSPSAAEPLSSRGSRRSRPPSSNPNAYSSSSSSGNSSSFTPTSSSSSSSAPSTSPSSTGSSVYPIARSTSRAEAGSPYQSLVPGSSSSGGSNRHASSLLARLDAIESRQRRIEQFINAQTGSQLESRLQMVLSEAEPAVMQSRMEAAQRLEGMSRTVERLDSSVSSFGKRMDLFAAAVEAVNSNMASVVETQNKERAAMDERLTAALDHFDDTRAQMEESLKATNTMIEKEIAEQAAVIGQLRQDVEGKADVRLVLDKVTKQEWTSQLLRLQQAADARDARTVSREEYKTHLNELRESIAADQAVRQSNIARLANELHALVQEVSSKASKADLVDVASVLHSFPKVHEELDHLRLFVDQEIASKQDLQQLHEVTVTHRQLRRQMDKLLRAIAEEVRRGENAGLIGGGNVSVGDNKVPLLGMNSRSGTCGTCLVKTSLPRGSTCLSCAARLQVGKPTQSFNHLVPTKGGGFAVVTPRRLEVKGSPEAPLALLGPPSDSTGPTNPLASSGMASMNASLTAALDAHRAVPRPATVGAMPRGAMDGTTMDMNATDSILPALYPSTVKREVGTDGKVYNTSRGRQTHTLVKRVPP